MKDVIEKQINNTTSNEVKLSGLIKIKVEKDSQFLVGYGLVQKIIAIKKPDIVIDGSNAVIVVEGGENVNSNIALFYIYNEAKNVQFKNIKIYVNLNNLENTTKTFYAVYNNASYIKLDNCSLEVTCKNQMNLTGIYNNGLIDTSMSKNAENMNISNCLINMKCCATTFTKECNVYGIYNHLSNSISVQNSVIYATNAGTGENQKAIGIYTNGRFGKFIGNNIKANSSHSRGKEKEQGHSLGIHNQGLYSIITSNNIVSEWAGAAIGVENQGEYAKISSNKILSTHTICGRCIRSYAGRSIFDGNILTTTSRNARLIENHGAESIITNNYLECFMPIENCVTGCGIYSVGYNSKNLIIKNNIIKNLKDCGIFTEENSGIVAYNIFTSYNSKFTSYGETTNQKLKKQLDEKNIYSIYS